ncbi:unnamed protein product, partial [Choristocarpus tenellus]
MRAKLVRQLATADEATKTLQKTIVTLARGHGESIAQEDKIKAQEKKLLKERRKVRALEIDNLDLQQQVRTLCGRGADPRQPYREGEQAYNGLYRNDMPSKRRMEFSPFLRQGMEGGTARSRRE